MRRIESLRNAQIETSSRITNEGTGRLSQGAASGDERADQQRSNQRAGEGVTANAQRKGRGCSPETPIWPLGGSGDDHSAPSGTCRSYSNLSQMRESFWYSSSAAGCGCGCVRRLTRTSGAEVRGTDLLPAVGDTPAAAAAIMVGGP